ncbi:MAG TPA: VCBS repeat-containing protein [Thermoanaerobaculia bacterium]
MKFVSALVLSVLLLACRPVQACDHPIARQFVPESLVAFSRQLENRGRHPLSITCSAVPTDFGMGGEYLVVGYSDTVGGAVRVLQRVAGSWTVAGSFDENLAGSDPTIELVDLTGDRRPEIIATFRSDKWNYPNWIFSWTGQKLISITPVSASGLTLLLEPGFVDVDNDGIAEILQIDEDGDRLYRFADGTYRMCGDKIGLASLYLGHEGKPKLIAKDFAITDSSSPWRVLVVNGTRAGKLRASSAVISLNGQLLVNPSDLNEKTAHLEFPVTLRDENTLEVQVRGQPDSELWVIIANADPGCD